jgi:hypothetical protein
MEDGMTELDPRARELIGLARESEGPSESDRSRLRAAVATRLGVVLASAGATATAGTASAAPVIGTSVGAAISKIVVAGALLCAVGAGGYAALSSPAPASRPQEKTAAAMARVAPAPEIASVPSPRTSASAALPPAAPPKTAPSGVVVSPIEAETRALGLALTDLRNGNAERALSALDAQLTRFPDGALAEERAEARIMALCSLGRTEEARDNAARFFVEHPRSVLAGRVRASCGGRDLSGH